MTAVATVPALDALHTREVARFGHRLALGLQWRDALTALPVGAGCVTTLERIGARPLVQPLIAHGSGRHALLHRDRVARLLALAAQEQAAVPPPAADPRTLVLRVVPPGRRHVPRRLALTPVLDAQGLPPATLANIRPAWLWPGADAAVPAGATVLRGRIRRGPSLANSQPVPWARVVVTRPPAGPLAQPPVFASETAVGWAHGDDRGEFLAVLGAEALPGGAVLPPVLRLTVWVSLPVAVPLDPPFDPLDPVSSLPLETAGIATTGAVLEGKAQPPGYARRAGRRIEVNPGQTLVLPDADLRFA